MCSLSTIICATHPDVDLPLDFVQIYSKSEKMRGCIQIIRRVYMYSFSSSFRTCVADSEHFIDKLLYGTGKRILYTLWERGEVGGCSHSSRTVGNPYNVNANRVPTSHQTLAVYNSLELGPTRWRWAVRMSVGLYMLVAFGSKRRLWPYTLALGRTHWR